MSVLSISLFIVPDAIMIIGHVYKVISAGNEKGEQTLYPRFLGVELLCGITFNCLHYLF